MNTHTIITKLDLIIKEQDASFSNNELYIYSIIFIILNIILTWLFSYSKKNAEYSARKNHLKEITDIVESTKKEYTKDIEYFKSELKEKTDHNSEIIKTHISKYWHLGEKVAQITHDTTQLLSKIGTTVEDSKGKSNYDVLNEVNKYFNTESVPIIKDAMSLKKFYVLLPVMVIDKLMIFEQVVWNVLKNKDFKSGGNLLLVQNELLSAIRIVNSELLSGELKLSNILKEVPENGFSPAYLQSAFENITTKK
jgi:hypothetical protein